MVSCARPVLYYLHGLNSSSASWKARALGDYLRTRNLEIDYRVPDLPWAPADVVALLASELDSAAPPPALIGSSMGGFYAAWLASRFPCKAVLINPVVRAHELLAAYLGENRNLYTGEVQQLEAAHLAQLRELDVPVTSPERLWLMVQTADETLDHRRATAHFRACRSTIIPGGSHGFDHFERYIPGILAWCGLPAGH